jgi:hypothetical protein
MKRTADLMKLLRFDYQIRALRKYRYCRMTDGGPQVDLIGVFEASTGRYLGILKEDGTVEPWFREVALTGNDDTGEEIHWSNGTGKMPDAVYFMTGAKVPKPFVDRMHTSPRKVAISCYSWLKDA